MLWLRTLVARFRVIFAGEASSRELDREIEEHLRLLTERFIRHGMRPEEAEYAARRQFGGVTQLREYHHDASRLAFIEHFVRDLFLSLRLLRKRPGFSLISVAILALGIGATTAMYSVAKAVVFAPLPFPNPDRLVELFQGWNGGRYEPGGENILNVMSVRNGLFTDWRERARCFENMAATQRKQVILMAGNRTEVVEGFFVGEGFFETFDVPAQLGRHFTASDFAAEGSPIVVLSDRMWRTRYNADRFMVGRDIVLDGAAHRVVGVMPPGFLPTRNERDPQLWLPMRWNSAATYDRGSWGNRVYARLRPEVTVRQAQAEMGRVDVQLRAAYPNEDADSVVAPLDGYLFGHHERMFVFLLAAVGLVLAIACANVANLFLARTLERQREFAVRSALGAARSAILRQVLAESLVVAGFGGLAGVAISPLLVQPALALLPAASKIPRLDQVHLDPGVLLFTFVVTIFCGLLFGVVPAIRAGRGDLSLALRAGGRGSSLGKNEIHLSDSLVVAEVGLSLVLLVGGGLLTHSFLQLLHSDPGFRPAQSVALQLSIPAYRYPIPAKRSMDAARRQLYDRLERAAASVAGVDVAGVSDKLPLRQFWDPEGIAIEGRPPRAYRDGSTRMNALGWPVYGDASLQTVSPGYFGGLGVPLIRGRLFDDHDRPDAPMTVLINEAAARSFFPNEEPIGKRIANGNVPMTIVGIVRDCRLDGMNLEVMPEIFRPMAFLPTPNAWLIARSKGDAGSIAVALQRTVQTIDPDIGIAELSSMTSVVGDSLWRERFSALLVGLFAAVAVLIASGGLYAVISHAVQRRTHELGVRLALGASRAQITHMVLGYGLRVTAIGVGLGAMLTMAVSRMLAHVNPGVGGNQLQHNAVQGYSAGELAWMLATLGSVLLVLTLVACWVPLRRALAVDPVTVLRTE
jgi:predicted permease